MIEGWGIAVDAVVADFIAGAAERLVLEGAKDADIVLVEGQGSINHPGYSGVTLGLLHGSCPDGLILCHQSSREYISDYREASWLRIPPLADYVRLYETIGSAVHPTKVIAISLNTYDLTDDEARRACETAGAGDRSPRHRPRPVRSGPAGRCRAERPRAPRAGWASDDDDMSDTEDRLGRWVEAGLLDAAVGRTDPGLGIGPAEGRAPVAGSSGARVRAGCCSVPECSSSSRPTGTRWRRRAGSPCCSSPWPLFTSGARRRRRPG